MKEIQLTQEEERAFVNAVVNTEVHKRRGNFKSAQLSEKINTVFIICFTDA